MPRASKIVAETLQQNAVQEPQGHTFRSTGITAYLETGGTLENAQAMAAHESPRTTKHYDRAAHMITLDEVERTVLLVRI
jgi:integrase